MKQDLINSELNKIYATVTSFFDTEKQYIIQISLGNYLPDIDDLNLVKFFVCNDDMEMQQALAITMQERNFLNNRAIQ